MFAKSLLLPRRPLYEVAHSLRRASMPASASPLQPTICRRSFASHTSLMSRIRPAASSTRARDNSASHPPEQLPQAGHINEDDLIPFDFDVPSSNESSSSTTKPRDAVKSTTPSEQQRKRPSRKDAWKIQKQALKRKFPEGWRPRKVLSPDAMDVIRHAHAQDPVLFSTPVLAQEFEVSPEAIRRILKSKWRPTPERMHEKREKYRERRERIWNHMVALGLRPPQKGTELFSDETILDNEKE